MPILPWGKRRDAIKRAEDLLLECCQRMDLPIKRLAKSGREWIGRRHWNEDPTEMRRLIYYAALTATGDEVEAAHFPPRHRVDHEAYAGKQFDSLALERMIAHKIEHFFGKLGNVEVKDVHRTVIAQVERPLIEACLKWAQGNQLKASRVLGINRNTLRKKIKELKVKYES